MRTFRLYQIDAFTDQTFLGNPAGVVPQADGLTDVEMQQIAREVNASETAFILSERDADSDLRVRYFSPTMEVPVCGHATIAAHFVRRLEGAASGTVRQRAAVGVLEIAIDAVEDGGLISMTQMPPVFEPPLTSDLRRRIAAALGLGLDDLVSDLPVQIVSTGHSKVMAPLLNRASLESLRPDLAALAQLSLEVGSNGFFPFVAEDGVAYGRMFAPAIGIAEDPVTGNAAGPLGAYLTRHGRLAPGEDGRARLSVRQGEAMGRPGRVEVEVGVDADGIPVAVRISGLAVLAFKSVIELDP